MYLKYITYNKLFLISLIYFNVTYHLNYCSELESSNYIKIIAENKEIIIEKNTANFIPVLAKSLSNNLKEAQIIKLTCSFNVLDFTIKSIKILIKKIDEKIFHLVDEIIEEWPLEQITLEQGIKLADYLETDILLKCLLIIYSRHLYLLVMHGKKNVIINLPENIIAQVCRQYYLSFKQDIEIENFRNYKLEFSIQELIDNNWQLDLANKRLDLVSKKINNLTGLKNINNIDQVCTLYLSSNLLNILTANSFNIFNNIRYLYLNNNNIDTLEPGSFAGLNNLTYLDLQKNKIKILSAGTFSAPALKTLLLNDNNIESIEENCFGKDHPLKDLYLKNNNLISLSLGNVTELKNLVKLYLVGNPKLQTNLDIISKLIKLQQIYFSQEQLNNDQINELKAQLPKTRIEIIKPEDFE